MFYSFKTKQKNTPGGEIRRNNIINSGEISSALNMREEVGHHLCFDGSLLGVVRKKDEASWLRTICLEYPRHLRKTFPDSAFYPTV